MPRRDPYAVAPLLFALALLAGVFWFYSCEAAKCKPGEELVQNLSRTRVFCAQVTR